jgi:LmbE family N-acetylglucosaminyl deacetylase
MLMLPLILNAPLARPLRLLALGAHPDDIEIGAGGTLLTLAESHPGLRAHYVVLSGTPERKAEARLAATEFLAPADISIELHDLPDGRFPSEWGAVKDRLERISASYVPDLVLAPSMEDAHQDHRILAEILPTVFRDQLYLAYEIPKWDGDLARPSYYVPLSTETAKRKVELLNKCFPSQHTRDWWDDDVFMGVARLRGVQCHAPFAEAFSCSKSVIGFTPQA